MAMFGEARLGKARPGAATQDKEFTRTNSGLNELESRQCLEV